MRTTFSILLSLLFVWSAPAQITYKNNCIRSGDEIIKQQVEYKDPGRSGENVIWDFSNLQSINDEYKLTYMSPYMNEDSLYILGEDTLRAAEVNEQDLIIGREHFTSYFYRVKENRLLLLGHANAVSRMHNRIPIPVIAYPLSYGEAFNNDYTSRTIYSGSEKMAIQGDISVSSDAYGIMILPDKDTLRNVTRIKAEQVIKQSPDSLQRQDGDTVSGLNTKVETYRWYVKGYRYPVFETIRNINTADSANTVYFATAFFYPPQDHYYLDTDSDNLAVLDSLENVLPQEPAAPDSWIEANFTYNYFPNPVSTTLNIEYRLEEEAEVGITLYSTMQGIVRTIPRVMKQRGVYTQTIDCSGLYPGAYVLRFNVRDEVVSNVILKN